MSDIQVGDVVTLKSGGPEMTVTEVSAIGDGGTMCVWTEWFDDKKNAKTGNFSLTSVAKKPETDGPINYGKRTIA